MWRVVFRALSSLGSVRRAFRSIDRLVCQPTLGTNRTCATAACWRSKHVRNVRSDRASEERHVLVICWQKEAPAPTAFDRPRAVVPFLASCVLTRCRPAKNIPTYARSDQPRAREIRNRRGAARRGQHDACRPPVVVRGPACCPLPPIAEHRPPVTPTRRSPRVVTDIFFPLSSAAVFSVLLIVA